MTITIKPTRATEGYYCEGPCNSKESVSGRPVMRITDGGGNRWYRCSDCSIDLTEVATCHNCGEEGELTTCSSCASHDECINVEDGHLYEDCDNGSCNYCGETPYYCSASCAISDGNEVWCTDCSETVHKPNTCSGCKAESDCDECKTSTGTPALVGAASTITNPENVDDDGNVVIDGLEIRF